MSPPRDGSAAPYRNGSAFGRENEDGSGGREGGSAAPYRNGSAFGRETEDGSGGREGGRDNHSKIIHLSRM